VCVIYVLYCARTIKDYPDTRTGRAYENLIATMEKEKFQRKPAGMRF